MADALSIKDLPDTSKIVDSRDYLVKGQHLRVIYNILSQLWRGENIGKGPNIRIRQNGLGGYTITGANQSSNSSAATSCPFDMAVSVNTGTSVMSVSFTPGTVNGVLPSNIFTPATIGYTSGATVYAIVTCETNGQVITSTTLSISSTAPTAQTPVAWAAPSSFAYMVGVIVDQTAYKTIACGNLTFAPTVAMSVPKSSVTPNVIPFDNYYTWLAVNGSG